jgi:pimeloyl-ACP methyl ester carboxylesterase
MLTMAERKFVNINTFQIAYRQWGESGKPIVLLHGIPMNSSLWKRTGTTLARRGYQVYAPEMLGLGYSMGSIDNDHSLRGQAKLFSLSYICR